LGRRKHLLHAEVFSGSTALLQQEHYWMAQFKVIMKSNDVLITLFYHKHYSTALATTDCHFEVDEKRQRALKEKSLLTASQQ